MRKELIAAAAILLVPALVRGAERFPEVASWKRDAATNHRVGRDERGRVVAVELPGGRVVRKHFDEQGRVARQQASNGDVITYTYSRAVPRRIESTEERGVRTELLYNKERSVSGSISARSVADAERVQRVLNARAHASQERAVRYSGGRAVSTTLPGVAVEYGYGPGESDLRQTLRAAEWSYWTQRTKTPAGGVVFSDSAGATFQLRFEGGRGLLLDGSGRLIASAEFDATGRIIRVTVQQAVVIDYEYEGGFHWTAKVLRFADGTVVRRIPRHDFPDPELDTVPRGQLKAPTGDAAAEYKHGALAYTASAHSVRSHLTSSGQVEYRTFSFFSQTPFGEDEIRLLPDGSIRVAPAVPHAEWTGVSRTVYPFSLLLPPAPAAVAASSSEVTPSSGRAKFSDRNPSANMYVVWTSCEWIPGGIVSFEGEYSETPGRWACTSYWYWYPDPYYPPENTEGGGKKGTTGDAYAQPISPTQSAKLNEAKPIAEDRLCNMPQCMQLFDPLSADGYSVLLSTTYLDGRSTSECQNNQNWGAWTRVNSKTVYLCGPFETASGPGAATNLIHEALHSAGMTEYPGDPAAMTSVDINNMVQSNCNLTW